MSNRLSNRKLRKYWYMLLFANLRIGQLLVHARRCREQDSPDDVRAVCDMLDNELPAIIDKLNTMQNIVRLTDEAMERGTSVKVISYPKL